MNYLFVEEKRTWIKGLALHCPMGEGVNGCPMTEIRLLPIKDRMKTVDEMGMETIIGINDYHNDCLARRTDCLALNN